MFKPLFWALCISAALLSCESRQQTTSATTHQEPAAPAAATARPAGPGIADTAAAFAAVLLPYDDSVRATIQFGGQTYRLQTSATTDPNRRLPLPVPADSIEVESSYTISDSVALRSSYGYDVVYTIRLLSLGNKPKFATTLHKADFVPAMGKDHVAESVGDEPQFCGYLPKFNALAFRVSFYLDETDDGGWALILLDATTGKVRHIGPYSWADGGQGSDALTPDGRTLLTGFEILHADGRHVSLARKNEEVAGTLLLNDKTVLAVYEDGYDAKTRQQVPVRGQNARLLDLTGRELGRFRFHGTSAAMGFRLTQQYLAQTRSYYLFDDTNNSLRIITRDEPLRHRQVSPLPKFVAPQRATEVRFNLNMEVSKELTMYVDTVSGAVRCKLLEL